MDKFDRIFQVHSILKGRRTALSAELLNARLECSPAALYRAPNTLKNILKCTDRVRHDSGWLSLLGGQK